MTQAQAGLPVDPAASASDRTWDRNRVLFTIVEDGQAVQCAISREALQELSDKRYAKPAELMLYFDRLRERVDTIAREKYRSRPTTVDGIVTIWSGDLDDENIAEDEPAA